MATNPPDQDFTFFFTTPHNSFSRIDYFFTSPALLLTLHNVEIGDTVISDHSPIILHYASVKPSSPSPTWRFPSYLAEN